MNKFNSIYPFTTEAIDSYFKYMDLGGKSVLTVGSSLDQAFNALVYDAKNVTVIDINKSTNDFYKLKRDIILNYDRDDFYNVLLSRSSDMFSLSSDIFPYESLQKMNTYLKDDFHYNKLRNRLKNEDINVIQGDIFNMNNSFSYDRIIFSNILQYIDMFAEIHGYSDTDSFLIDSFASWKNCLTDEGILELSYYYCFLDETYLEYLKMKALLDEELIIKPIKGIYNDNSIVTYKKS